MSVSNFADLAKYAARPFPLGYPVDSHITLYAPDDNLHGALGFFIDSVQHSLSLAMYGFDDDTLATAILRKLQDEKVYVQLVLDSTQAAGKHEKALLATVNYPSNTVVIGRSEKNAIMHLKTGSIDGLQSFSGSTNWSESGEDKQDNELTFVQEPLIAFRTRHKIDLIAESIRTKQAAEAKRLQSNAITNTAAFGHTGPLY
jgi:phosphatidylserine/phosphatidylglycerophosphate/cardiolipin synthase-like enzyme